ncbi:MAG: GNAT family N-acetyltransferase, partial [Gammaproteobacteria bacterium]
MPNFTLRRAEARDSEELAGCIEAAYSVYASRIDDLPAVGQGVANAIEKHRVWVAETKHIIGGLILILRDDFLLLENIAVRPECTGMGLGRALIHQAERDCRELGLPEIRL